MVGLIPSADEDRKHARLGRPGGGSTRPQQIAFQRRADAPAVLGGIPAPFTDEMSPAVEMGAVPNPVRGAFGRPLGLEGAARVFDAQRKRVYARLRRTMGRNPGRWCQIGELEISRSTLRAQLAA